MNISESSTHIVFEISGQLYTKNCRSTGFNVHVIDTFVNQDMVFRYNSNFMTFLRDYNDLFMTKLRS